MDQRVARFHYLHEEVDIAAILERLDQLHAERRPDLAHDLRTARDGKQSCSSMKSTKQTDFSLSRWVS